MNQDHNIQPGKECPDCGTYHAIMDSLPERSLTEAEVHSLNESEKTVLAEPVYVTRGATMPGVEDDLAWATDTMVLATDSSAKVLSLHEGYGWVVDVEEPLDCDCCTPEEHGKNLLLDSSEMLKRATSELMGGDPIASNEEVVRWAIDEFEGV